MEDESVTRREEMAAAQEEKEIRFQEQESQPPFAPGGPIFVPGLIGPLSSIPDFKDSVLQHLQDLEAVLSSAGEFEEELSVDELRILTEEELVEKALKEDNREDVMGIDDSTQLSEYFDLEPGDISLSGMEIVPFSNLIVKNDILGPFVTTGSSCDVTYQTDNPEKKLLRKKGTKGICQTDNPEKKLRLKRGTKRGRRFDRECRAAELEGSYLEKVKQYAMIKQKQDEDKLAARLHSFSGTSRLNETSSADPDKVEKMRSLRLVTSSTKVKSTKSHEYLPVCFPEVILCVEVYHKKNTSKKTQEVLVLGSQNLTKLKDSIYCFKDKLMETAGEYDHSGYFLIEDTFYNDLRNPTATDYSKPILDWYKNCYSEAKEKWEFIMTGELNKKQKELLGDLEVSSLPKLKAADMHRTRFSDLQFKLGAGYLYCHQGSCKHIIVVRDMRMIHPEDAQNQAEYPLLTFQLRQRQRKCSVCDIYHAVKMTVDDKWAPNNPCYYCVNCYFLLHYNEDGSLLYHHKVFDYFHE